MTVTSESDNQPGVGEKLPKKPETLTPLEQSALNFDKQTREIAQRLVGSVQLINGNVANIDQIQAAVKISLIDRLIREGKAQVVISRNDTAPFRALNRASQRVISDAIDGNFPSTPPPQKPEVPRAQPAPEAPKALERQQLDSVQTWDALHQAQVLAGDGNPINTRYVQNHLIKVVSANPYFLTRPNELIQREFPQFPDNVKKCLVRLVNRDRKVLEAVTPTQAVQPGQPGEIDIRSQARIFGETGPASYDYGQLSALDEIITALRDDASQISGDHSVSNQQIAKSLTQFFQDSLVEANRTGKEPATRQLRKELTKLGVASDHPLRIAADRAFTDQVIARWKREQAGKKFSGAQAESALRGAEAQTRQAQQQLTPEQVATPAARPPEKPPAPGMVRVRNYVDSFGASTSDGQFSVRSIEVPSGLHIPEDELVIYREPRPGRLIVVESTTTNIGGGYTVDTEYLRGVFAVPANYTTATTPEGVYLAFQNPDVGDRQIKKYVILRLSQGHYNTLLFYFKPQSSTQQPVPAARQESQQSVASVAESGVDISKIMMSVTTSRVETTTLSDGALAKSVVFSDGKQEVRIPFIRLTTLLNGGSTEYTVRRGNDLSGEPTLEIQGRDQSGRFNREFSLHLQSRQLTELKKQLGIFQPDQQIKDLQRPSGKIGVSEMQGKRPTMEDAHQHIESFMNDPKKKYLAIFDGHGGKTVALQAANRLHQILEKKLQAGINPDLALNDAFLQMDQELVGADEPGATAVVGYIDGLKLWVANIGDARAVVSKGGKAECLTVDHKASDKKEKKRIKRAGGEVYQDPGDQPRVRGRSGGGTAVSRAFGDHHCKGITAEPHLQSIEIKDLEFVVMACDGVWDVLPNQEVIDLVREAIEQGETDPQKLSDLIIKKAFDEGSTDNISALVLLLK